MDCSDTERRLAIVGLALVGIGHLLVPGELLRAARYGYGRVLDVEFSPRGGAPRRVRLLGVLMVSLAAALWRRVVPGAAQSESLGGRDGSRAGKNR
jgi:hypothetical protein